MGARENIQKLIDKKTQEMRDLDVKQREIMAYIQALQDSLKVLPREAGSEQPELRPHSALARTRDLIKNSGKPLHISEILKLLGKPSDKKNRVSISGTLSSYARSGRIFTKTAPNTFGLLEFREQQSNGGIEEVLPASFGKVG
jgi:hypothetical protein